MDSEKRILNVTLEGHKAGRQAGFTPPLSNSQHKCAFTLAEVLVTLGIIGVVAAITLSALFQKYQAKVILTQLNKSYAELQTVVNRISNDYGENILNIVTPLENSEVKELFMKYYDGAVDCKERECYNSKGIIYYTYTGSLVFDNQNTNTNYYFGKDQFLTKEGRLISFGGTNIYGRMVTVDLNGPFKKPNAWGRDTFTFLITDKQISPCGGKTMCSNIYNYNCNKTENGKFSGIGCTYYALTKPDFLYHKYYYENYMPGEL